MLGLSFWEKSALALLLALTSAISFVAGLTQFNSFTNIPVHDVILVLCIFAVWLFSAARTNNSSISGRSAECCTKEVAAAEKQQSFVSYLKDNHDFCKCLPFAQIDTQVRRDNLLCLVFSSTLHLFWRVFFRNKHVNGVNGLAFTPEVPVSGVAHALQNDTESVHSKSSFSGVRAAVLQLLVSKLTSKVVSMLLKKGVQLAVFGRSLAIRGLLLALCYACLCSVVVYVFTLRLLGQVRLTDVLWFWSVNWLFSLAVMDTVLCYCKFLATTTTKKLSDEAKRKLSTAQQTLTQTANQLSEKLSPAYSPTKTNGAKAD
jgi:hypothetical protein